MIIHDSRFFCIGILVYDFSCLTLYNAVIFTPDADTNMKVNLLDLLNDYTDSEKEHRRDSIDVPVENWSGRWMPSRPHESTPPPKIFHQDMHALTTPPPKIFHKDMHASTTPPPKIILKSNNNSDGWTGKWMPSRPGEPTPPPKIFHKEGNIQQHDDRIPMGVISHECDDGKVCFYSFILSLFPS